MARKPQSNLTKQPPLRGQKLGREKMNTYLITEMNRAANGMKIQSKTRAEALKQAKAYGYKKPSVIKIN